MTQDRPKMSRAALRCGSVAVSVLKPGTKRYERWLSKRNRRRAATMKKQQEDTVFKATNLRTGETITQDDRARIRQMADQAAHIADPSIMFWTEEHRPQDYVNCVSNVPTEKVTAVIEALQGGETRASYRGWANCRICNEHLGSQDLGNHGFKWPQMAEHYIQEHGVWTQGLDRLADTLLSESTVNEERELDKSKALSCGVFLPLPFDLAKDFPDKSEHDDSIPHYTLLYVGDCTPEEYKSLCTVVRGIALKLKPFPMDLASYGEFMNKEGMKISSMGPSLAARFRMAALHGMIRRAVESLAKDVKVKHTYGPEESKTIPYEAQFKPHATLAYLPRMMPYTGPKPTGSWRVTEIECWGHEKIRIPLGKTIARQPIGLTRDPIKFDYPMAVPEVTTSKKEDRVIKPATIKIKIKGKGFRFEAADRIPGGLADGAKPSEFDPKQLAKGVKVELEHTSSRAIATEIAMDHLKEDPRYYDKLAKIEKRHEDVIGGSMGASGHGTGGSSGDIGLDGSLPYLWVQQQIDKKLKRRKLKGL